MRAVCPARQDRRPAAYPLRCLALFAPIQVSSGASCDAQRGAAVAAAALWLRAKLTRGGATGARTLSLYTADALVEAEADDAPAAARGGGNPVEWEQEEEYDDRALVARRVWLCVKDVTDAVDASAMQVRCARPQQQTTPRTGRAVSQDT
jgi:hypothetical protein